MRLLTVYVRQTARGWAWRLPGTRAAFGPYRSRLALERAADYAARQRGALVVYQREV